MACVSTARPTCAARSGGCSPLPAPSPAPSRTSAPTCSTPIRPSSRELAALPVARWRKLPLVYEIRAFWEDAAVGNGTGMAGSLKYRATRALEGWGGRPRRCGGGDLRRPARRPARARRCARENPGLPNGVDLTLFGAPPARDARLAADLGLDGAEVVGFIGSFYPMRVSTTSSPPCPRCSPPGPTPRCCSSAAVRRRPNCAHAPPPRPSRTASALSAACPTPRWSAVLRPGRCARLSAQGHAPDRVW